MTLIHETAPINELIDMLTYKRPAGSNTEKEFITHYLLSLPGATQDSYGNIIVTVGTEPTTMFSSHTDSVHQHQGRQSLLLDPNTNDVFIAKKERGDCLGADCATGVWLMRQMILNNIPGLYIFHREEESGGQGARHIATTTPELVKDILHAIAFDRYGFTEIITHQAGGRCCSDTFAKALGAELNLELSRFGTFTDTACYTSLVPECTNIAVGYKHQHTENETQNLDFAKKLLDRLLQVNFDALPVERKPICERPFKRPYLLDNPGEAPLSHEEQYQELLKLCKLYPGLVADVLFEEGYEFDYILELASDNWDDPSEIDEIRQHVINGFEPLNGRHLNGGGIDGILDSYSYPDDIPY